ncbi:MAG: GTP 3',8-cyclase MoaA [Pseudomonadota bacterium]
MTEGVSPHSNMLTDPFGRRISYLRMSVTDRCDLRCTYCMPERMTFLPRKDLLSFEEMEQLALAFVRRGVRKIRLTGGEPLVRKDIILFIQRLGVLVKNNRLEELTMTTNGVQLGKYADQLADAGVRRINVSLDTLNPAKFEEITRRHRLKDVLDGIEAAKNAGLKIKLNTVALKYDNASEIPSLISWAHERDIDISLIEVMPMGDVDEDRLDQYLPLTSVQDNLKKHWTLHPDDFRTGGPSRYWRIAETGGRVGFISPLTQNFCDGCNRVRLTATGQLYQCLGQDNRVDFRSILRSGASAHDLDLALDAAIANKPHGHDFRIKSRGETPSVARTMSTTGG